MLTKKKVSEVEHTPIPVVLGSNMAIGQSLSMVVLHRSCGTRRRPKEKQEALKVTGWLGFQFEEKLDFKMLNQNGDFV